LACNIVYKQILFFGKTKTINPYQKNQGTMSVQFELPSGKVLFNHTFPPNTTLKKVHTWIWLKVQDKHMYQVCLFDDHDFSKPLLPCSKQLPKDVKVISVVKKIHPRVEKLKQELDQDPACLAWYAEKGDVGAVNVLLALKANPNMKDISEWTPLHWASAHGNVEVAQFLVQAKADPTPLDGIGYTPRHWASRYGHEEVAALLEQAIKAWKE
jgi:hypothetical protein